MTVHCSQCGCRSTFCYQHPLREASSLGVSAFVSHCWTVLSRVVLCSVVAVSAEDCPSILALVGRGSFLVDCPWSRCDACRCVALGGLSGCFSGVFPCLFVSPFRFCWTLSGVPISSLIVGCYFTSSQGCQLVALHLSPLSLLVDIFGVPLLMSQLVFALALSRASPVVPLCISFVNFS